MLSSPDGSTVLMSKFCPSPSRAVRPRLRAFLAFTSAPRPINNLATSRRPSQAAICSAVAPESLYAGRLSRQHAAEPFSAVGSNHILRTNYMLRRGRAIDDTAMV
ncbi:hypothetical protein XA68_17151 [Ophiocordyceps unilateralis]|uniref:Uncharacterized protein n=1 Tax=Ophiocordyceps unilateralis TaxID=268505 RepID=A0A2A9PJT7_OPHUN|nr:hypothetical protein XA68_17151 [Ophiocordyceps unilateralis]